MPTPGGRERWYALPVAHVLLVDDDADMRLAIEYFLAEVGHEVVSACDGSDALSMLAAGALPDVAVIDCYMPIMNGLELAKAMRDDARLANIPIIMISAAARIPHLPGTLALSKDGLFAYLPEAIERVRAFKGKLE